MYIRPTSSFLLTSLLVVVLAGCLPYSCRRTVPQGLFPADSLSRRIAIHTPSDTLEQLWSTKGPDNRPLKYPNTLLRRSDGLFFVSDAARNSIYVFSPQGSFLRSIEAPSFSYPFLAGFRGDTLVVLNRGSSTLDFVLDGTIVRTISVPKGPGAMAVATDEAIYYKTVGDDAWLGDDVPGYITRIDASGDTTAPHVTLPGPYWRHRGFLRMWGDTLVSLSGYRPVIDMVLPGGELDTLALTGFNSPMLSRSRAFMKDAVDTAPVLTSSAVPADSLLFVLNLRPYQLRIDVYNRRGRLQRILQTPQPSSQQAPELFPLDLAAFRDSTGALTFAVVFRQPVPALRLYSIDE